MGERQGREGVSSTNLDTAEDHEHVPAHAGDSAPAVFASTGAGTIPPVLASPGTQAAPSASQLAFGPISLDPNGSPTSRSPIPLADPADLQARGQQLEAERLLKSQQINNGNDAIAALDVLLAIDPAQQGKVIDRLDDTAFENLLERLAPDQLVRLETLVAASQKPRRKLRLWAAQHKATARMDLRRYAGDFGDPEGAQTDAQIAAQHRYERREEGVRTTEREVQGECAALLAKGDALTVADVDAMRARKDKELAVETEHNVNLRAESTPRQDGSAVVWEAHEIEQLDAALDKLPDRHARDDNSVATYDRRANRHFMQTLGGQYHGDSIDIYDNANDAAPGREQVPALEYAVTHEVGHEVASENKKAFAKFEQTAGWGSLSEAELVRRGATDEQLDNMHQPQRIGDKLVHRGEHGGFVEVDATAVPSHDETGTDRWKYSLGNAGEHFAEMYAMAVETPDLLYADYVERPAARVRVAQQGLADARRTGQQDRIDAAKAELASAKKVQAQRKALFDIVRDEVFQANASVAAAVGRLRRHGLDDTAMRAFQDKAARVSTPAQIAALEREAMR